MSRTFHSHRLILCASALALVAGAAQAQTVSSSGSGAIAYTKASEIVNANTVTISGSTDSVTYTVVQGASWLNASCGTCIAGTGDVPGPTDTLSFVVVPSVADAMAGGTYTTSVALQVAGVTSTTVSVTLTLTASASPLSSSPSAITLTYVSHGVANQTLAKTTSTISGNDTLPDTYTINGGSNSIPNWLSVASAHGTASLTSTDTLTFQVIQTPANSLSAGPNTFTIHLSVANNPDLTILVTLNVIAQQPLVTTTTSVNFAYTIGASSAPAGQTASITVASGTMVFNLDPATVPAWLTATANATATTSGVPVTFTPVTAVVKGLAAGNYSGSIGYEAVNATSELLIPVVLTVSNPTAIISIKGNATNTAILNYPGATTPTPTVTVLSSDEPAGFTATCSVTSTYPAYVQSTAPCTLGGASTPGPSVTGIAYTFGTVLTNTFDPALFASGTPFGTVVTLTVRVTSGTQSPVTQSYAYSIQPVAPTFSAVTPTSAALITSNSLVFTLTGTNFVGPGSILASSSIVPTQVFVGATNITANTVVVNGTTMLVSVPAANFPAFPTGKTVVNMVIGSANETGLAAPTAATATQTVVVTTAPVIYALTSTATYVQPNPGSNPSVAPYELVSLFGANFGPTANLTGTLNAFSQFNPTVNISGLGTTASPFVTMGVTFKQGTTVFKAPILFANGTQINCIVPAGLTTGQNTSVTVTAGTTASDGLFVAGVVASQPGIFTLASDGVGQGAILNQDYSVNGSGNPAAGGTAISIYMTGLGVPNSVAVDNSSATGGYSAACVTISGTTTNPGYLQVANTTTHTYTAPSPVWTNIDGAEIMPSLLLGSALPPCFVNSGSTAVTVTFGTTPATGSAILYAGFAPGSVAGLYQINVTVPNGLTPGNVPVKVSLGSSNSPAGVVTVAVQ